MTDTRLYEARKQNQILNLKQFQKDRNANLAFLRGSDATAKAVASETGVSWRNLDEQRAVVIGRLYQTVKLAQGRPSKDGKGAKFAPFSGSHATAKGLASSIGVGERTVRYAAKFTEALEALEQVSLKATKDNGD